MGAYHRRHGEDRVTEVFATVLAGSPQLVNELLNAAGVESAHPYEIETQVRAEPVTIDLQIRGLTSAGTVAWLLWAEHKVDDPLTAQQLKREQSALASEAEEAPAHLIAITKSEPRPDVARWAAASDVPLLRWGANIERAAHEALARTDSEREEMLLREWLDFAREKLEAPVERLTTQQVRFLPKVEPLLETLDHLLTFGFAAACAEIGAGEPKLRAEYWEAEPPVGSWLQVRGFKLFATLADDGYGHVAGPCFALGGWLEGSLAAEVRKSRELHPIFKERGFGSEEEDDRRGGWIEWGLPISLEEIAERETLAEQEAAVAEASTSALKTALAPPSAESGALR